MRVLHTADWHLNARLGHQDLTEDICASLQQIATYLDKYEIDVMLVAGDVFEHGRTEKMRSAIEKIRDIFLPFLEKGGTIVAISGNHDNDAFFETLHNTSQLVAPGRKGVNGTSATGRLYIIPSPGWLKLADKNGQIVQFVLMPYPRSRVYPTPTNYRTREERNRFLQQEFTQRLASLKSKIEPQWPSILVSHIHVRGAKPHNLYRIDEADDVIFEPGAIPSAWAYIAYGHIHAPQKAVKGASHIRYAGSIQALAANEAKDKSVVLFEIGSDNRLVGEPELLPLKTTPIYQINITDPDKQIPYLTEQYPDHATALIKYTLHWEPGKHNLNQLHHGINQIFPRWYDRKLEELGTSPLTRVSFSPQQIQNTAGTVRDYLQETIPTSDPDREVLLNLVEELIAEEDV